MPQPPTVQNTLNPKYLEKGQKRLARLHVGHQGGQIACNQAVGGGGASEGYQLGVDGLGLLIQTALSVVDGEDRLVGIVTVDDAMDVLEEEAAEDIEKMAAILPTNKPYFQVVETWKHRVPWLLLLMISADKGTNLSGVLLLKRTTARFSLKRLDFFRFLSIEKEKAGNTRP